MSYSNFKKKKIKCCLKIMANDFFFEMMKELNPQEQENESK